MLFILFILPQQHFHINVNGIHNEFALMSSPWLLNSRQTLSNHQTLSCKPDELCPCHSEATTSEFLISCAQNHMGPKDHYKDIVKIEMLQHRHCSNVGEDLASDHPAQCSNVHYGVVANEKQCISMMSLNC